MAALRFSCKERVMPVCDFCNKTDHVIYSKSVRYSNYLPRKMLKLKRVKTYSAFSLYIKPWRKVCGIICFRQDLIIEDADEKIHIGLRDRDEKENFIVVS